MDGDDTPRGTPVGRRVVLGMVALGGAGIVWGSRLADAFNRLVAPISAMDGTGLTSLLPAAGRFRIYSVVGFLPKQEVASYRLRVTGLVERPLELTASVEKGYWEVRGYDTDAWIGRSNGRRDDPVD